MIGHPSSGAEKCMSKMMEDGLKQITFYLVHMSGHDKIMLTNMFGKRTIR